MDSLNIRVTGFWLHVLIVAWNPARILACIASAAAGNVRTVSTSKSGLPLYHSQPGNPGEFPAHKDFM